MSPADPGRDRLLVQQVGSLVWAGDWLRRRLSAANCWAATMTHRSRSRPESASGMRS